MPGCTRWRMLRHTFTMCAGGIPGVGLYSFTLRKRRRGCKPESA